jgi:mannose-1-phosphate guanylyltransferase/phosphomannomutase
MTRSTVAALIMAGGRSERMRAGGSAQHKGLRTVLGVPLIECNLRALLWFGFKQLFVAINAQEQPLATWIEERGRAIAESQSATLEMLLETKPLGTIGAVASLPQDIDDAVIVNVDNLTSLDLRQFAQYHREHRAAATIATHAQPFPIPFGMLDLDGQRVVAYREKPELSVSISSGTYVLNRRAIDRVPAGRRLDVPALVDELLQADATVLAYPHREPWIDVNDETALAHAQQLFSLDVNRWPGAIAPDSGRAEP